MREALAPSAEQVAWAARTCAAWEAARERGEGVLALEGQMVDAPVARRAQAILRRSGASG